MTSISPRSTAWQEARPAWEQNPNCLAPTVQEQDTDTRQPISVHRPADLDGFSQIVQDVFEKVEETEKTFYTRKDYRPKDNDNKYLEKEAHLVIELRDLAYDIIKKTWTLDLDNIQQLFETSIEIEAIYNAKPKGMCKAALTEVPFQQGTLLEGTKYVVSRPLYERVSRFRINVNSVRKKINTKMCEHIQEDIKRLDTLDYGLGKISPTFKKMTDLFVLKILAYKLKKHKRVDPRDLQKYFEIHQMLEEAEQSRQPSSGASGSLREPLLTRDTGIHDDSLTVPEETSGSSNGEEANFLTRLENLLGKKIQAVVEQTQYESLSDGEETTSKFTALEERFRRFTGGYSALKDDAEESLSAGVEKETTSRFAALEERLKKLKGYDALEGDTTEPLLERGGREAELV